MSKLSYVSSSSRTNPTVQKIYIHYSCIRIERERNCYLNEEYLTMTTRKLIRDFLLSHHHSLILPQQGVKTRLFVNSVDRRGYSVFNEFSKKVKDETVKNPEFQKSVKELKEKAEELKGIKEGLKEKTKQTTEQLYRQFDSVWKEAEAAAKKLQLIFQQNRMLMQSKEVRNHLRKRKTRNLRLAMLQNHCLANLSQPFRHQWFLLPSKN
ncbi:putative RGS domain-containing protein [Medicago truncatula]|uniref:Putative RGS domain-containing protein n=1 Tax=Medicago truncatula TaxID=3880 RepID=A0A396I1G5_MEDTR|nr:putative RGS domain-containing protein [Medicago truncatula]